MTSGAGSIPLTLAGVMPTEFPAHNTSKAALNELMVVFYQKNPSWKINCCTPPCYATSLTDEWEGKGAPPSSGAVVVVNLCEERLLSRESDGLKL